jgi:hypothetical protein
MAISVAESGVRLSPDQHAQLEAVAADLGDTVALHTEKSLRFGLALGSLAISQQEDRPAYAVFGQPKGVKDIGYLLKFDTDRSQERSDLTDLLVTYDAEMFGPTDATIPLSIAPLLMGRVEEMSTKLGVSSKDFIETSYHLWWNWSVSKREGQQSYLDFGSGWFADLDEGFVRNAMRLSEEEERALSLTNRTRAAAAVIAARAVGQAREHAQTLSAAARGLRSKQRKTA